MRPRGLTLIEAVIALAVLAVLATIALPGLGASAERARLKSAAETLAADLSEARFEAATRGAPLAVTLQAGQPWCWAVGTTPGCGCAATQQCQLKTVSGVDHGGIAMLDGPTVSFDPAGTIGDGAGTVTTFQSSRGEQLRVVLGALGRASVCSPGASVPGYPGC